MRSLVRLAFASLVAWLCFPVARLESSAVAAPAGELAKLASDAKDAGRLREAADLLAQARRADPGDVLLMREACRVTLALEQDGQRVSSREPCHTAYIRGSMSAEDMRNEAASMMAPSRRPSLDDLVVANLNASAAAREASDEPWGYLARCDIARRMSSAEVMASCLADLRRVAPDHPLTKQALALTREPGAAGRWLLRSSLMLLVLGTLAHALHRGRAQRRLARRPMTETGTTAAAFVVGLVVLCGVGAAHAQAVNQPVLKLKRDHLSSFEIDKADPESTIPPPETLAASPLNFGYLIQDLGGFAEAAMKRGDHAAAARFFLALAKLTPNAAYGSRKACVELEASGDLAKALMACRAALTKEGTTGGDYAQFVRVALANDPKRDSLEHTEIDAVVAHVAKQPDAASLAATLRCQVALKFDDVKTLAACTGELTKSAANDPATIAYQWALAVQQKDRGGALSLIEKARKAGASNDSVLKMEQATREMGRQLVDRLVLFVAGGAILALVVVMARRRLASRKRAPA